MANLPPEKRFTANLGGLIPIIKRIVLEARKEHISPVNIELLDVANNLLASFNPHTLVQQFIDRSHPYWEQIRNKQSTFFINHAGKVFEGLQVDIIHSFRDLYNSHYTDGRRVLQADDEELLWSYFHSMVKISIKYAFGKRKESPEYAKELDLNQLIALWGVKP